LREGLIYALCEPSGDARYIGKTVRTARTRRGEHIREAVQRRRQSPVHGWIRRLVEAGDGPVVWVLEDLVPVTALNRRECEWISAFKGWGADLLNYTGGGNGALTLSEKRKEHCRRDAAQKARDGGGRFTTSTPPSSEIPDW
jgi:hypothetical protein